MNVPNLRSPYDTVGGIVYFGRMLDKIRLNAQGKLPPDYHANLGIGFDERCVTFLGVAYPAVVARTAQGGTDDEIFEWCCAHGHRPSEEQVEVWNGFAQKRGWKDDASPRVEQVKQRAGISHRKEITTFFDLIELDEDRPPRMV